MTLIQFTDKRVIHNLLKSNGMAKTAPPTTIQSQLRQMPNLLILNVAPFNGISMMIELKRCGKLEYQECRHQMSVLMKAQKILGLTKYLQTVDQVKIATVGCSL